MSKYITANGYSILKSELSEYQQKLLKKDLTFTPLDLSGYGQFCDNSINLYRESQDRVYMPRFYGLKKFGEPDKDYLRDAPRNKLKLSKIKQPKIPEDQKTEFDKRREMVQKQAIKACKKRLKGPGGGILVLPCGYGKTRTALKIWLKLKVPVIILAHKEYLLEQFEEEIRKMVHDPKIGYISGKKVDYEQKDVLLAMIQSFISKDLDWKAIKSHYQMMIADECHQLFG
jgi:superfamily II DNA or RNA helicase